jgi:hypothetical protein
MDGRRYDPVSNSDCRRDQRCKEYAIMIGCGPVVRRNSVMREEIEDCVMDCWFIH